LISWAFQGREVAVLALETSRWYPYRRLQGLAEHLAEEKVASAVVVAGSVRRRAAWTTEIGAAGRLAGGTAAAPVTGETWFDLASLTKPVTALAAARLVRAGRLTLGVSLGSSLPELRDTCSAPISLELLLSHRAGLEGNRGLYRDLLRGRFPSRAGTLIEAASARTPDALPDGGERVFEPVYSDLGYLLAGEVIARAAGKSLDEVMVEQVIAPLGAALGSVRQLRARDAAFDRQVAATELVAWRGGTISGAVHDENAWCWSGEGCSGHAGLFGNAAGVLTLGRAVIDIWHGRLDWFLKSEELYPLVEPRPGGTLRAGFDGKSETGSSAGTRFGPNTIGHLGFTGTSFWCDPDGETVGVLLTNRVHPSRSNDAIRKWRPFAYDRIAEWAERRRNAGFDHR
jgi:serine-type D-Ala-D-Ala carboxypeptidase